MSRQHEWGPGQSTGSKTVVQEKPKALAPPAPAPSATSQTETAQPATAPSASASAASAGAAHVGSISNVGGQFNPISVGSQVSFSFTNAPGTPTGPGGNAPAKQFGN